MIRTLSLLALLVLPHQACAEEISFLIETTFASSPIEPVSGSENPLPTGRAGRRYIERLNEQNNAEMGIVEEDVPSATVPIIDPDSSGGQNSSSYLPSSFSSFSSESIVPTPTTTAPTPTPTPTSTHSVKEQEELDELTLQELEEYANEAEANLNEQLQKLEDGFTVTGTSTLGSPLPSNQRRAILRRSIRTVDQLKIYVRALSETDENLRQIKLNDERIELSYRQKAKLFGFIPITYLLKTTVEDSEVSVDQPWWHFLARDDVKEYKKQLQEQLDSLEEIEPESPEDLDAILRKQQQVLQTLSNVSKMLHDTGMAIIRNIGA